MNGLVKGIVGGAVGLLAMGFTMKFAAKAVQPLKRREEELQLAHEARRQITSNHNGHNKSSMALVAMQAREGESATDTLARLMYTQIMGHEPSSETRSKLSNAIHWSYGLVMAVAYAVVRAPRARGLDITGGAVYGVGLWLLGDEVVIPVLGLSKEPTKYPMSMHATMLMGHIGYGVATAATTRALHLIGSRRARAA